MEFRSGEALVEFDAALRIRAWNDAAAELTGIPADEAVGRYTWEVLAPVDEDGGVACHAGCTHGRLANDGWPVASRNLWIRTANGRQRVILSTIAVRGADEPRFVHLLLRAAEVCPPCETEDCSRVHITPRQREVLELLAAGVPAKAIALRLGLSTTTVRNHIQGILNELDCHSQLEAVATARRLGLVSA